MFLFYLYFHKYSQWNEVYDVLCQHHDHIHDNGIGFNEKNYKSFETPFSKINKEFGCKGIGRFTAQNREPEYPRNLESLAAWIRRNRSMSIRVIKVPFTCL